ncbi:MAG: hypothetical protein HY220_03470 [Candidatus Sungbacteria bacterium]|uniref:Amino acid permease n=1 Tax=Candidatus Sungiibacteriota bacterium TaxID=2750080 RepID=A0A9D6QU36_9BACT|nr:hypothetical protein [Candidatus Sungbacteria bacterium]
MSRFIQALALFIGSIIGVGVFALPFVFSEAGFLLGSIELLVLTVAVIAISLMYGDVILAVQGSHQLPGYAKMILGKKWVRLGSIISTFNLLGALVVYVILGTKFLGLLISQFFPAQAEVAALLFYFTLGLFVFFYDSAVATEIDSALATLLLIFMAVLIILGLTHADFNFIAKINLSNILTPYGPILFALTGVSVIPRVARTLGRNKTHLKQVLIIGTIIPAIVYFLFVLSIIGASPHGVSRDAISGLAATFGSGVVMLGALVGFLSTSTAYCGVGLSFRGLLQFDFGLPKRSAWLLAAVAPFLLYGIGISDFVRVVSFIGSFTIAAEGIFIVYLWKRLRHVSIIPKHYDSILSDALIGLFVFGLMYGLILK